MSRSQPGGAEVETAERATLGDEWTVVRSADDGRRTDGTVYEARVASESASAPTGGRLVLVRETSRVDGRERQYRLPEAVFRGVVEGLP